MIFYQMNSGRRFLRAFWAPFLLILQTAPSHSYFSFEYLLVTFIVTVAIAVFLYFWYVFLLPSRDLKVKYRKLNFLIEERKRSRKLYNREHDEEAFKRRDFNIKTDQNLLRKRIIEKVREKFFLKKIQSKKVKEKADREIKKALSYFSESNLGRRLWLYGISKIRALNLLEEKKEEYSDMVKEWREEGLARDDIEDRLREEQGFSEYRASAIVSYEEGKGSEEGSG